MNHNTSICMIRLEPAAAPQFNQPLGFMYLCTALRRNGYWNMRIMDIAPQRLKQSEVLRELRQNPPGVIFLTASTVDLPNIDLFSEKVSEACPRSPILIGGSHPSGDPVGTLQELSHIDVAVVGEGETTIGELLPALEPDDDENLAGIEGIAYRKRNGEIVRNPPRPLPPLDDSQWPAYDLINIPRYFRHPRMGILFKRFPYMTLFTSRGCTYNCEFCHEVFGKQYRAYSAERVLDEMEWLYQKHGIREFQFADDLFNYSKERVIAICDGILSRGLKVALCFPNGLRMDRISDEEIVALAKAGTWRICISPETASLRLQKYVQKNNDLERIHRTIQICNEQGIMTSGFFMVGFPTETEEELRNTIDWALESKLHTANFFRVIPFPGSKLRDKAVEQGLDLEKSKLAYEGAGTNFNLSAISREKIEKMHRDATRRFYLNPRRLLRLTPALPWRLRLVPVYFYELFVRTLLGTLGPQIMGKLSSPKGVKAVWRWLKTGDAY